MMGSAVKGLITANVIIFILQYLTGPLLPALFALWPLQPEPGGPSYFHLWQLVTYAFLHSTSNLSHLLFNMFGLWMFGTEIERYVGPRRFLTLYFSSVITAALTQLAVPTLLGASPGVTYGASGGVFGLLLAYALMFPHRRVVLLIPPIPMPAWLFATLYAGLELFLGVTGVQASVAHFAHLGGMIGSAIVFFDWRRRRVA